MDSPQKELMSALSALHLSGKYSDLKILCNSKEWAVHRVLFCSRSGFFDGACSNAFLEAETGVIDLSDDDEEAVENMIHYFYHLDYLESEEEKPTTPSFAHRVQDTQSHKPRKLDLSQIVDPLFAQAISCAPPTPITPSNELSSPALRARRDSASNEDLSPRSPKGKTGARHANAATASPCDSCEESDDEEYEGYETDDSYLLTHARVYTLADKYGIPGLKSLAKHKFERQMACYYDSPEFADAVEEVYTTTIDTDRGLRNVVLQAFRSHPRLANTQDVFEVIKRTPTLAFDLWRVERGIPV